MNIQKKQQGFTLIELMIVIAIVGILAAIALPAYQDYTVRAKMSEALANMAESKTSIAEYFSANNKLPASAAVAGILTDIGTDIVASVKYSSPGGLPLLEAVIQEAVIPNGSGLYNFVLSGTTSDGNRLVWKCKAEGGSTGTTMVAKYLPANCRG